MQCSSCNKAIRKWISATFPDHNKYLEDPFPHRMFSTEIRLFHWVHYFCKTVSYSSERKWLYIYIFPVFVENVVTIVLQCDLISTRIYPLFKENAAWYKMMNRYVLYISVSIWAWYWKKIYQDLSVKGNIKCQLRMKFFCIKKT